jgi:hypothetical protein
MKIKKRIKEQLEYEHIKSTMPIELPSLDIVTDIDVGIQSNQITVIRGKIKLCEIINYLDERYLLKDEVRHRWKLFSRLHKQ